MFEQGHLTLSQVSYFYHLTSLLLRSYIFKRGIFTMPATPGGHPWHRWSLPRGFLLCFPGADPGWGAEGPSQFLTEEPVPSGRPEQHGHGRAICFQSRSRKSPPARAEGRWLSRVSQDSTHRILQPWRNSLPPRGDFTSTSYSHSLSLRHCV